MVLIKISEDNGGTYVEEILNLVAAYNMEELLSDKAELEARITKPDLEYPVGATQDLKDAIDAQNLNLKDMRERNAFALFKVQELIDEAGLL